VAGASAAAWPHRPELGIDRLQTYKSLGFNLVSGSPRPDMWLHRCGFPSEACQYRHTERCLRRATLGQTCRLSSTDISSSSGNRRLGRENRTGEAWQHMHLAPQVSAYGPDLHQLLGATDYTHQPDGFTQAKSTTDPSVSLLSPNLSARQEWPLVRERSAESLVL